MKREKFLQRLKFKLYDDEILIKPKVYKIIMSSGRTTNVVIFSIKEMTLHMVTNEGLFTPKNLLLNPKDPFADSPELANYGEVH